MKLEDEIIVGLDLGSTMTRVAIGKQCNGNIEIIGVGQSPSLGMRKGTVVNPEDTAIAIRQAIKEAELMAGCRARNVVVGIAGLSIGSQYSHVETTVKQGKISEQDIRRVIESAHTDQLPPGCEILHIIPCEFVIDKQIKTNQPLGVPCSTLEAKVHIVTVESISIKNVVKACKLAGLNVLKATMQSLATAETILLPAELKQGVALIEMGGGPLRISVFSNGTLRFITHSLIVSKQLTCDLAQCLHIKVTEAELLKCLYGCVPANKANRTEMVEVVLYKDNTNHLIPLHNIVNILGMRMDEVFTQIAMELKGFDHSGKLVHGAVITGGSSILPGIKERAKRAFNMPVRTVKPGIIEGEVSMARLTQYSTAVGLVLLGSIAG